MTTLSLPPLTTLWTKPDACSSHWTYGNDSGTYYTYITQDWDTTIDTSCRHSNYNAAKGTFSPGVCPYQWTTWSSAVVNSSITSAMCCPRGYINQGPECASLFTTPLTVTYVFTTGSKTGSPTITSIGPVRAGTAVVSAVHVLHQASDESVLPTQNLSDPPSSSNSATGAGNTDKASSLDAPSNRLSSGAIAGIAIGCSAVLVLISGLGWYAWKSRRQLKASEGGPGGAELHGEESNIHEIVTTEKPTEVDATPAPVEASVEGGMDGRHVGPPAELEG